MASASNNAEECSFQLQDSPSIAVADSLSNRVNASSPNARPLRKFPLTLIDVKSRNEEGQLITNDFLQDAERIGYEKSLKHGMKEDWCFKSEDSLFNVAFKPDGMWAA